MVHSSSTLVLFFAAVLALATAFPWNPSLALKLSPRIVKKYGVAPKGSVRDKRVLAFVESYLSAISSCDFDKFNEKFAVGYVAFVPDGRAFGLTHERGAFARFCKGFKGTTFSLVEANQVAPNVVFIRVEAKNDDSLPSGPYWYSQALCLERSLTGFRIKSEVRTSNKIALQAAVGG